MRPTANSEQNLASEETYEVFGQMRMGPCQAPPPELEGKTARIKCADGEVLEVSAEALALSFRAKKDLLEKGCDQDFEVPQLGCTGLHVPAKFSSTFSNPVWCKSQVGEGCDGEAHGVPETSHHQRVQ